MSVMIEHNVLPYLETILKLSTAPNAETFLNGYERSDIRKLLIKYREAHLIGDEKQQDIIKDELLSKITAIT
ncbi:MAG: hypothetical protein N2749_05695 [Clostridia bacterium]|nr:hypothetical protein [Clostridia bacterium]